MEAARGCCFITEGRMLPLAIVKPFDELKAGRPYFDVGCIAHSMVTLVLEVVKPALCMRVIPAIAFSAHRAEHAANSASLF
jgi:hypothetical protein